MQREAERALRKVPRQSQSELVKFKPSKSHRGRVGTISQHDLDKDLNEREVEPNLILPSIPVKKKSLQQAFFEFKTTEPNQVEN